jgi:hypothetical protein
VMSVASRAPAQGQLFVGGRCAPALLSVVRAAGTLLRLAGGSMRVTSGAVGQISLHLEAAHTCMP